jgi:hypothetical protein
MLGAHSRRPDCHDEEKTRFDFHDKPVGALRFRKVSSMNRRDHGELAEKADIKGSTGEVGLMIFRRSTATGARARYQLVAQFCAACA